MAKPTIRETAQKRLTRLQDQGMSESAKAIRDRIAAEKAAEGNVKRGETIKKKKK